VGREYPSARPLALRLLGTVGEPINPKAWLWYHKVIGGERCPIVDTWWQTETGHIMITTLPGLQDTKPGSAGRRCRASRPAWSTRTARTPAPSRAAHAAPAVARDAAHALQGRRPLRRDLLEQVRQGRLLRRRRRAQDEDGYYWIIGRVDDVINVSGHRMSTAEIESAIVSHEKVAEAAVIGQADEDTGQSSPRS
jgi:acetyl-CoA synthetase